MSQQSNASKIETAKSNLPLPEQPPVKSDFNSADASTVNVGSGGISSSAGELKNNDPMAAGRQLKDNLSGLPDDAVTREAKGKAGLAQTTNKDYGYPEKSDPSSGIQK